MDPSSVLECTVYSNLGYLPWGRIQFFDKMRLVEANYDFQEYSEIEVTIKSHEDSSVSEITFKAEIFSSSIKNSIIDNSMNEIELIFILRGASGNLLSAIDSVGYNSQSSISVIRDLCKKKGIPLTVQSNLNTQDSMSWIIANHNLLTSINYLCDRSYIENSALIYNISLDGVISIYGIREKFLEKPKAIFMSSPHNYLNSALNNGELIDAKSSLPVIYYREKQFTDDTGFGNEYSSIELKEVSTNTKKNKVDSKAKQIIPDSSIRKGSVNTIIYQPSNSPQVYSKYQVAPLYRKAIIASYSLSLNVLCNNETFVSPGDVVSVIDGSFGEKGEFNKTTRTSGKYIILRKGYHFKRDPVLNLSSFQTTIQLISNKPNTGEI